MGFLRVLMERSMLIWCLEETRKFYLEKNYDELYKLLMVFILNKCVDSYFYCYRNLEHDDKCYELMKFFKDKYGEYYKECCDRGVFGSWNERVKYRWDIRRLRAFVKGSVVGGLRKVVKGK